MADDFDPDAYLKEKQSGGFDPDIYLKGKTAASVEQPAEQPEQTTGLDIAKNVVGGIVEPAAKLATGIIAKPVSDIAGLAATGYEAATGDEGMQEGRPEKFKESVQQALTYEPRTSAGKSEYNPLNFAPEAVGKAINAMADFSAKHGGIVDLLPGDENDASSPKGAMVNLMREAIPQALSVTGAKTGPGIVAKPAETLKQGAKKMMQSAIKPSVKDLKSGKAATAIDTMLEKGYSATPKGIEQIRARIDDLNDEIRQRISASPDKVKTGEIVKPVINKLRELRNQVNPDADISALKKSWKEFKNHPFVKNDELTVEQAQKLKQGTYQQLRKKYGQAGTAETETQKTIARGLKEQIAKKVPQIEGLNKEESRLLTTLDVSEQKILMQANKNPMGLALLAKDPAHWAAFMADRSAPFKSLAAHIMHRAGKKLETKGGKISKATKAVSSTIPSQTEKNRTDENNSYEMGEAFKGEAP